MTRAQFSYITLFLTVLVAALVALFVWPPREAQAGMNLRAQAHTGEMVSLSELPGDVRLIYFGFMNCPDVCLDAALSIGSTLKSLDAMGPEVRDRVTNVFVTLDPDDDVIEGAYNELEGYMDSRYGGNGVALRPRDEADVRRMASAYGIAFEYVESDFFPSGYRVDHASLIFLTDKSGRTLAFYPDRTPGAVIAHEIGAYLERI